MYIFQFPRVFPQFREAGNGGSSSVAEAGGSGSVGEGKPGMARKIVKKKKPTLDDWLGWGKGGKRTECMGVPPGTPDDAPPVQGQIGELVIRRSGRVQMVIADVAYDVSPRPLSLYLAFIIRPRLDLLSSPPPRNQVLPGAQPTFHQEIAVIDPSPLSHLRAMFVLGSTNHKFIVAPDVSSLLKREQSLKASSGIS
jgi:DNA-directed RNA polymerase III subunit RPC4